MSLSILKRIPMEDIVTIAHILWSDKAIADRVAADADATISQAYQRKFVFFNGKSSKCVVGGLFYLLSFRYDSIRKQREISDKLGTTDVTVRASYRQWLANFPDLFPDVIGKLAENPAFRYSLLIDLQLNVEDLH
jgi:transcription initiation factor TFIIIB Brf1 subunit/transcription initiation factor TFIIB